MHILIAPNAFKNSLGASLAAKAISVGLKQSRLNCSVECFPVADGGDGTAALIAAGKGGRAIPVQVTDPIGREIMSQFYILPDRNIAVIEMADASGLRLLSKHELSALNATSKGTGQLIAAALNKQVSSIILCVGGTATTDAGCGILQLLGTRFIDAAGRPVDKLPLELERVVHIDNSAVDSRLSKTSITILCDVDNHLLGPDGAIIMFAPQKGASTAEVESLQRIMLQFNAVTFRETGKEIGMIANGGAAGGTAAGLHAFLNAELAGGAAFFLDLMDFDMALERADIVITGEGNLDAQTIRGKAPFEVARRAKRLGKPVIALAGKVDIDNEQIKHWFDVLLPIGNAYVDINAALEHSYEDLERTAMQVGNLLAAGKMF